MTEPQGNRPFTCRVCDHHGLCDVYPLKEMMYGSRESFEYVRCAACGCLQIGDIPVDLDRHYPADYYSQQARTEPPAPTGLKGGLMRWYCRSAALRPHARFSGALCKLLPIPTDFAVYGDYLREGRLHNPRERILDVGCGASPVRLAAMRRCGFLAVEGIDPYVAADTTYAGVPVYRRTLDQVQGEFGMVMFHHSLEHVPNPVETLTQAARLLRPNGTCLVRIPVMGTYFWRHFGVDWVELDAPRHLHLLGMDTMQVLAERTGFTIRRTVFDSERWEFTASVRCQRGIPLRAPIEGGDFSAAELQEFERQTARLNQQCDAGRACFYLERI